MSKCNKKNIFIYLVVIFLAIVFVPVAWAADLFYWPTTGSYYAGDSILIELKLDSEEIVNAIDAKIEWSPEALILNEVTTGGSIFDLWITGQEVESDGDLHLQAGSTKGYSGSDGLVIGLLFTVSDIEGNFFIKTNEDAIVVKSDGKASQAELKLLSGQYNISKKPEWLPTIISERQSDSNSWYQDNTFDVHWQEQSGFLYSYLLTRDITLIPDKIPETDPLFDVKFEDLDDGIYYFHLIFRDKNGDWSPKVTKRVMIDKTPPQGLQLLTTQEGLDDKNKVRIVFNATDNLSGISSYQIKVGDEWQDITSPYDYDLDWSKQTIDIRVVDQAGNYYYSKVEIPSKLSNFYSTIYFSVIIILVVILVILFRNKIKS